MSFLSRIFRAFRPALAQIVINLSASQLIVLADFVLVYEEELCDLNEHRAAGNTEDLGKSLVDKAEIWRQKFKTNLLRNGVHIEEVGYTLKISILIACTKNNYAVVCLRNKFLQFRKGFPLGLTPKWTRRFYACRTTVQQFLDQAEEASNRSVSNSLSVGRGASLALRSFLSEKFSF